MPFTSRSHLLGRFCSIIFHVLWAVSKFKISKDTDFLQVDPYFFTLIRPCQKCVHSSFQPNSIGYYARRRSELIDIKVSWRIHKGHRQEWSEGVHLERRRKVSKSSRVITAACNNRKWKPKLSISSISLWRSNLDTSVSCRCVYADCVVFWWTRFPGRTSARNQRRFRSETCTLLCVRVPRSSTTRRHLPNVMWSSSVSDWRWLRIVRS